MNNMKGLEALKEIKEFIYYECVNGYEEVIKTIEKELKDYYELKDRLGITDVVKEDFASLWKEHKALEIIKNMPLHTYIEIFGYANEEEKNLLKEVLWTNI